MEKLKLRLNICLCHEDVSLPKWKKKTSFFYIKFWMLSYYHTLLWFEVPTQNAQQVLFMHRHSQKHLGLGISWTPSAEMYEHQAAVWY